MSFHEMFVSARNSVFQSGLSFTPPITKEVPVLILQLWLPGHLVGILPAGFLASHSSFSIYM
jgi:hypothetical protein